MGRNKKKKKTTIVDILNRLTLEDKEVLAFFCNIGVEEYEGSSQRLLEKLQKKGIYGDGKHELLWSLLMEIHRPDVASVLQYEFKFETDNLRPRLRQFPRLTGDFIGRDVAAELQRKTKSISGSDNVTEYFSLIGSTGLGKTQMALWFCNDRKNELNVIWFMNGDGRERMIEGVESLMTELGLEYNGIPIERRANELEEELNSRGRWLIVVDDVEGLDIHEIKSMLPEKGGLVLLTTTDDSLLPVYRQIELHPFTVAEASSLFVKIFSHDVKRSLVEQMGSTLGYFPLALPLCARYVNSFDTGSGLSVNDQIERVFQFLLAREEESDRAITIRTLIENTIERLDEQTRFGRRILTMMSLLGYDGVSEMFLRKIIERDGKEDGKACIDKLEGFGLASRDRGRCTMHRIVKGVVKDMIVGDLMTEITEDLIHEFYSVWIFDHGDSKVWRKKQELGDQAMELSKCRSYVKDKEIRGELAKMHADYVWFLIDVKGDLSRAEIRQDEAELVGSGVSENEVRAELRSSKATLRMRQNRIEEAIELYREGLELEEREVRKSSDHNNVATCLRTIGRYGEALEEYKKSLEIKLKYERADSLKISNTYDNIGLCYSHLGNHSESLAYHTNALKIVKGTRGEVSPLVAACYNNIGLCYYKMGKLEDSLRMKEKTLKIWKQICGEEVDDLNVARSLFNLGTLHFNIHSYDIALNYFMKTLEMRERLLGTEHPLCASCKKNIRLCNKKIEKRG